jgi:hypothetical protein
VATFNPYAEGGRATRSADGKTITGTLIVAPGYRLISAEVIDGAFLVTVFETTREDE